MIGPPDVVWALLAGVIFGATGILWFAAIIVLKVQEPAGPPGRSSANVNPLTEGPHTDWRG